MPVDYESLTELGAIMGSGGLIVMDEDTCMVDVARFFLDFVQDESCGKCAPCRIGTKRMLEILDRICEGKGEEGDIERLDRAGRDDQGHRPVRPGPDRAEPGALHHPPLPRRVRGPHPRQEVPGRRLRRAGAGALPERLPGGRGRAGLRLAHRREALRRGAAAAPRAQPLRVGLRPGLLPPLREQVPPRDAGRAALHPRPEALHGRAGDRVQLPGESRRRRATPGARSPSSAPARPGCPARTSWPAWATSRRSSRPSASRAACWCRPFPPTACRARSWPARSDMIERHGRGDRDRHAAGQGLHAWAAARAGLRGGVPGASAPRSGRRWASRARKRRA